MKQVFTLLAAFVLSFFTANAQISQTFESTTSLSQLTGLCWQFSGIAFSSASQVTGTNSLEVTPTTSSSISATASTPYVSLANGASISLNYRLSTKLSTNANRLVVVKLQAYDGTITTLTSVSLDKQSPTTTQAIATVAPLSGVYKVVIDVSGSGDGNSSVYVDDLSIAGAYNYSSPYNCNGNANSTLPIHLESFQAVLQGEQVQLVWQVSDNGTGEYFEVEKSTDGRTFKTIAIISTTEKQGNEAYSYSQALQGTSYYRLKVVNKNKSYSYSNVVFAKEQAASATALSLLQNPVKQSLRFTFTAETAGTADVVIYNVNGAKVSQTKVNVQKGANSVSSDLQNVNVKGTYLLEVRTAETRNVVKFIKD